MAAQGAWGSYGTGGKFESGYRDIESGGFDEASLRWGFVRKVYGILASQVLLTLGAAWVVVGHAPLKHYLELHPGIVLTSAFAPFFLMCALWAYRRSHPWNLVLLALFSLCFSVTLGSSCAYLPGEIVLQALLLTAVVTVSLTLFTFHAARNGQEFSFLGPALFSALMVLVCVSLLQLFFPFGGAFHALVAGAGALVFSLYVIYDTSNLLANHDLDDYVWASLSLYLDIVNLFLYLLQLLSYFQGER